jgi:hypothetical protein
MLAKERAAAFCGATAAPTAVTKVKRLCRPRAVDRKIHGARCSSGAISETFWVLPHYFGDHWHRPPNLWLVVGIGSWAAVAYHAAALLLGRLPLRFKICDGFFACR